MAESQLRIARRVVVNKNEISERALRSITPSRYSFRVYAVSGNRFARDKRRLRKCRLIKKVPKNISKHEINAAGIYKLREIVLD